MKSKKQSKADKGVYHVKQGKTDWNVLFSKDNMAQV